MKFKNTLFLLLTFLSNNILSSQQYIDDLGPEFHEKKRQEFRNQMPSNSIAFFFTSPIMKRSNDTDFMYHQDPNFYYLTGWKEPHGVLVIFKDNQQDNNGFFNEILFVRERNEYREMWDGRRLGLRGAKKMGFDRVMLRSDFIKNSFKIDNFSNVLSMDIRDDVRDFKDDKFDLYDLQNKFLEIINDKESPDNLGDLKKEFNNISVNNIMSNLRQTKDSLEIKLLTKAIKISSLAQIEVMKAIHGDMTEREVQGIHEFIYRKYGAAHEGYNSIVGAGANSCILHYITNESIDIDNQLILMDLGAEYRGYTADVTRTIPANGKFSPEQKEIYDLVYESQEAAIKKAVIGNTFNDIYLESIEIISDGLIKLGIIADAKDARKYYPHGVSHHIGLDVHDPGSRTLEKNMVITVEPGIYIPENSDCDPKWWNIGVRIEDDILITGTDPINLSEDAPRLSNEIEKLMEQDSPINQLELPNIDD
ncbi:aminopeptidase P N-terminal domain-containing protein [Flavobacteriaceae bacterium]|nr:aminopeptidase P N-terminal domain-containing protein [Flavobacteriaceae bacterium]MDB3874513.1 aminopeptidase P N-terminal domain-containing protein [Flavobacteriaceae bacterium]